VGSGSGPGAATRAGCSSATEARSPPAPHCEPRSPHTRRRSTPPGESRYQDAVPTDVPARARQRRRGRIRTRHRHRGTRCRARRRPDRPDRPRRWSHQPQPRRHIRQRGRSQPDGPLRRHHHALLDRRHQSPGPGVHGGGINFGAGAAWDGLRCLDWPYAGDDAAENVSAPNSATTIVVIGSTGDPETPYVWSQAFTRQLGNAQLITNNGPYHSAYFSGAACVEQKTNAYLFNGALPGTTTCG
jgi:hypothetical protein